MRIKWQKLQRITNMLNRYLNWRSIAKSETHVKEGIINAND